MKTALKAKLSLLEAVTLARGGGFLFFYRILFVGCLLIAALSAQAATYYVSPTGNDTNSGASWDLAKQTIQGAINISANGDTVLVADGTYAPITIVLGITVRSVNGAQATIIDGGGITRCAYVDTNAVLDGFTVRDGYSFDNYGGSGVFVSGGTVRNCAISGNIAYRDGGGVYAYYGTVENCVITGNTARYGGGVLAVVGTVQDCTISGNFANYGGGVETWCSTVENCTISGNTAGRDGGGVYAGGSTVVKNCTISGNKAYWGGGVDTWDGTVQNCILSGNTARYGGGVSVAVGTVQDCTIISNSAVCGGGVTAGGTSTVKNCMLSGNTAYWGGGVYASHGTVQDCTISGNLAFESGGGVNAWGGTVQDCTISGNLAFENGGGISYLGSKLRKCTISGNGATWGGGVEVWFSSSTVENCLIIENWATYGGGGVLVQDSTVQNCTISSNVTISTEHPAYVPTYYSCGGGVLAWNGTVQNCAIRGNWSADFGGGIYAFGAGCKVQNCTFSENATYFDGGGIYLRESTVQNCLLSGNTAFDYGGGMYTYSGTVQNCTISGNTAGEGGGVSAWYGTLQNCVAYYNQNGDVCNNDAAISYSCFGTNIAGIGNITNEPQFLSNGIGYGTNHVPGNYRLQPSSPCINAGLNQSWMTNALDLDGKTRILRDVVDMGAYEGSAADILIMRHPETFSNWCSYGSNAPSQTIEVWNAGTNAMEYALSDDVDWLSLSPASGTSTGEVDLVSINYGSVGLALGIYTGIVTITSAEAINSPQTVAVYLLVDKLDQTIIFPAIPAQVVTSQVGLAATASSSLPVSFAVVSGPGTITDGTNLSFTAGGTVQVVASQAGDAIYKPAPNVTNVVLVERIRQMISFPPIPETSATQVGLGATASSGLPVSYAVVSGPGIISQGTNLRFTAVGTVWVVASQAGNAIYYPAPNMMNMARFSRVGQTIYVSPMGNDANNGTSWELAKQTIQGGINVASVCDTVLVADGTYGPITITPGIAVRSVNGAQATAIDGGGVTRCVYMPTNAVLDGFTVRDGYSSDNYGGSGVFVSGGTLENCMISGNIAYWIGGGVYAVCSVVRNCAISTNTVHYGRGGGVYAYNSTVQNCTIRENTSFSNWQWNYSAGGGGVFLLGGTLEDCTISENRALYGGGVVLLGGTVENCIIRSNSALWDGGGMHIWGSALRNCLISGNTTHVDGGGAYAWQSLIENCVISGNAAGWGGGLNTCEVTVRNCTISSNSAYESGGGMSHWGGPVQYCIISENTANWGGGIGAWVPDAIVENCLISGNTATNGGGGALVAWGGTVQNCILSGNKAIAHEHPSFDFISPSCGGGVLAVWDGIVHNCQISENWSGDFGGGVYAFDSLVQNCTLNENAAYFDGGGACVGQGKLWNCLVGGNAANDFGGGVYSYSSTVYNCTLSGNTASNSGGIYIEGGTAQNFIAYYNQNGDAGGTISNISYSCIGTDIGGVGNITNEPQFVAVGTGYGTNLVPGNYRLRPTSPCINKGLNQSWMTNAIDLDGLPRILDGVVDMGAYEWSGTNILIMRNPTVLFNQCGYGSNAASQTIEVWNAGTNAMTYALSANVGWLSISPASGTSVGETDLASVNYASAGLLPGSYTGVITITSAEAINSPQAVTVNLAVDKASQTIIFPPIPVQVTTSKVGLAATASSGLPVSFAVASGPGIISGGTNLTFTAAGTVQVVVSQPGNEIYNPAPEVTNTFLVEMANQTITFPAIPDQTATSRVGLVATASSGLPVSFTVVSGPGTISGRTNLLFTGAGTVQVKTSQAGDAFYNPAPDVANLFNVTKALAAVTLHNLNQTYNGTPRSVTASTVPAGLRVELTYDGSSSAPTAAGIYAVAGVVNDSIYEGAANGTLTVAKADQTIVNFNPTNGSVLATTSTVGLAAQASSGLPVTNFTVISGPGVISSLTNLTVTNSGLVSVTVDQAGDHNWNPAPAVTNTFLVERASQTIIFPAIPDQTATSRVGLVAKASSGLPVSFAVVSGPGIISDGTDLTFTGAGTMQIVASQAGDAIYAPASDVVNSFNVTKATADVTLHNLNQTYNGTPRSVTASTVPAGLTVEITYDGSSFAPVNAETYAAAGVVNDSLYEGAANGILTVAKADQVITSFTPTNGAVFTTTSVVGLAAQASSGLLVTNFKVVSGPGVISGLTNLTFTNFGSVSVTVDQAGDHNWNPAQAVTNSLLIERIAQTIIFPAIPDQTATSRVGLVATASSELPVSFAVVSGPGIISGGTNLTFTGAGIVQVKASQAGDAIYNPAPDVVNSFSVAKAPAAVTLHNLNQIYNGTPRSVTASTVPAGLRVELTYDGSSVAPVNAGTYAVIGVVNDSIYNGSANGTLMVAKADQAITSFTPTNGAILVTTSTVGLAAQASSGLPVTNFAVLSGSGVIIGLTNLAFTNSGLVSVTVDQDGDHNWNPAPAVTNTIFIERAGQTIIFPPIPIQVVTSKVGLAATSSSGLPVSFAVASGPGIIAEKTTLTFTSAGKVYVAASQSGNAIWEAAPLVTNEVKVTILPVGVIQFAVTSVEIGEAGGSIALSVERTGGSYGPVSVEYTAANGTALAGADYTMQSGTLSWADGEAASKAVTIFITDDIVDENHEAFTVRLSNVQGANLGSANVAEVTILDNDEPPRGILQFAVTSVEVNEGGGAVNLTVTRTDGSYGPASVEYLASAGTANAELDYEAAQGTLSWADGDAASKTITVAITDDSLDESDETFTVTLSNAQGASLGSASSATVTILDNDEPPSEDLNKVDLEVAGFKFVPVNLWAGDNPAEIEFDLVNAGPGDLVTAGTQLEISFYLSANQTLGDADDLAIGTKIEVLSLASGSQTTIRYPGRAHNTDVTIPEGLSGDYYVFVSVRLASSAGLYDPDGASAIREGPINVNIHPTDEDDNRRLSVVNDYDGDGKTDLTSYDESSGAWAVRLSGSGQLVQFVFGGLGYESVPGDYDGDSQTDPAIHQRSGQAWSMLLSGQGYAAVNFNFGGANETRGAVGDYLGTGQANPGLYEEQSGRWYVLLPDERGNYEIASAVFGGLGYQPVVGDYDGDVKADPAVYAEATGGWLVMLSGQGYGVVSAIFGGPGYAPVVGDYDGDGKADPMLSTGSEWVGLMSGSGYALKRFSDLAGTSVAGDFDGDGIADPAVISAPGVWSFLSSLSSYARQGPYAIRP